jgi:cytochrome c biogenesis protein
LANYLVHTSLLLIFAGAIYSGIKGFEGGANIPEGGAVDTFLLFKEGGSSGLQSFPGTAPNERLMPFRVEAEYFHVDFYPDYPGRPRDFRSKLNILDRKNGALLASKVITVNDPFSYENFTFYQASYGSLGDFDLHLRFVEKSGSYSKQDFQKTSVGKPQKLESFGLEYVVLKAMNDVQSFGPGVQIQELRGGELHGEPFWVLKNYPTFDFENRNAAWGVTLEEFDEKHFTGLQIAYDPGAPIYWLGCLGMLLGTFYALFIQHKRYHLRVEDGEVLMLGSIHRLPLAFEGELAKLATRLIKATEGRKDG